MKAGGRYIDAGKLLIADFDSRFVIVFVDCRLHFESCFGGGTGDEINDGLVARQWATLPVFRDEAEQA